MNVPTEIVCRVPRTQPTPEWEARRHKHEAEFWAQHLDYLEKLLPGLRRKRGDDRASRLMRDVVEEIRATHGEKRAQEAREWLRARWRGQLILQTISKRARGRGRERAAQGEEAGAGESIGLRDG